MDPKRSPDVLPAKAFTEAEYRADPGRVITHAEVTGRALVTRADGTPRFMIAIPPAEADDSNE